MQEKRREQLALVENIFCATRCPPKVCEMGGIHILPGLALRPPLVPKPLPTPKKIETKIQNEGSSSVGGRGTGMGGGVVPTRIPGTAGMNFNAFNQLSTGSSSILGGTSVVPGGRPGPGSGLPPSLKYPTHTALPRASNPNLCATLKSLYAARGKKGWAGAMWRHTIALVISDIRYCTMLYCVVLYHSVLYYTLLYCTALYCTALYYTVLYYTAERQMPLDHTDTTETKTP